jgi:transcriptional regulator with XRE-family HTH domain|tara:strand:+ start:283 stop:468 length:186 start_codon:yes stop_codon:yes gene_type:complete
MNGEQLKELRLKNNMTQKDVAKKLGYFLDNGEPNRSQIARFENDHAPINKRVELAIRYIFR